MPKRTDLNISAYILMLLVISIFMVFSSIQASGDYGFIIRHITVILIGILMLFLFSNFNYQFLREYSGYMYFIFIVLLFLVIFLGKSVSGGRRWFSFGLISFQPSEPMKLIYIMLMARLLSGKQYNPNKFSTLMFPLFFTFLPMMLILIQPDMGTALVFFPVALGMFWITGIRIRYIVGIISFIFIVAFSLLFVIYVDYNPHIIDRFHFFIYIYKGFTSFYGLIFSVLISTFLIYIVVYILKRLRIPVASIHTVTAFLIITGGLLAAFGMGTAMKDYQKRRLAIYLNPNMDPLGTGYQIIQSKIAVGSGNIFGKGMFQGTQSQLGFLPARHTDFLFAVLAEELGMLGVLVIFILYFLLISRGFKIAINARDSYGAQLASGISLLFFSQAFINVAMVIGLLPVSGLPLPFLSYGGTAMITNLIGAGIILNVAKLRYIY